MSKALQGNKDMKIEHITHKEAYRGRSFSRPTSATQKVKDYFSAHRLRFSDQGNPREERIVTMWPRSGHVVPSDNLPEMTAHLSHQRRAEREARKEEKAKSSTDSNRSCLPLRMKEDKSAEEQAPATIHQLRHKGKFSVARRKISRTSSGSENPRTYPEHNLEKLQKLQKEIKDGKLERVVPRMTLAEQESRLAPPRPTQNPFLDASPTAFSTSNSRNGKTKLASSKVASYIGTSADIFDETRRDLQVKFRPPFEYLSYPTFSLSRRTSLSSENSDYSFCCKGEEEVEDRDYKAVQALKGRQIAHLDRRLSGDGMDPWTHPAPATCRLCKKSGVGGVRGLCSQCEKDFMRPKAPALGLSFTSSSSSSSEGIKPTPPLKDRKTLSMRKPVDIHQLRPHIAGEMRDDVSLRPIITPANHMKLANVESKFTLHNPAPVKGNSLRVEVEEGSDDENWTKWQTKSMREEFERTQGMFGRWSDTFEDGGCERYERADDKTPLIDGSEEDAMKRKDGFYSFWDDVLEER